MVAILLDHDLNLMIIEWGNSRGGCAIRHHHTAPITRDHELPKPAIRMVQNEDQITVCRSGPFN
jgi:hypothetical protein